MFHLMVLRDAELAQTPHTTSLSLGNNKRTTPLLQLPHASLDYQKWPCVNHKRHFAKDVGRQEERRDGA